MRFVYAYTTLVAFQIFATSQRVGTEQTLLDYVARPLPLLALWFYFWKNSAASTQPKQRLFTLFAFGLYWLGNVYTMLTHHLVVASWLFCLGNLCNLMVYHQDNPFQNFFIRANNFVIFFAIVTVFLGVMYLLAHLPLPLRLATIGHVVTSTGMALAAFNRIGFVSKPSERFVLLGVNLFICGSLLLSINSFIASMPLSNLITILVFSVANYLMVEGILRNPKPVKY